MEILIPQLEVSEATEEFERGVSDRKSGVKLQGIILCVKI